MVEDVASWFGIVDPQADEATCQLIRASADDWINQNQDPTTHTRLILATLSVATGGVTITHEVYEKELESLFNHVSASRTLTGRVSSNDLCLRIFCLMVLNLILEGTDNVFEKLVAEVLVSGLSLRKAKGKAKLEDVFTSCLEESWAKLDKLAVNQRTQSAPFDSLSKITSLNLADATGVQSLSVMLTEFSKRLERMRKIDREELDILWWMLNGYSEITQTAFREMPTNCSIIACGVELASVGLDPPASFIRNFLRRQLKEWFHEETTKETTLEDLQASWGSFDFSKFLPSGQGLIEQHPHIFPLHWTILKFKDGISQSAWQKEFEKRSGLSSKESFSLEKWGIQAFQERVALNLWASEYGN